MTKNRVLKHLARYRRLRTDVEESGTVWPSIVFMPTKKGVWEESTCRGLWVVLEMRRAVRPFVVELSFIQVHGLFRNRGELGAAGRVCFQRLTHCFVYWNRNTQTFGSSHKQWARFRLNLPKSLCASHRQTWIQTLQQFGTESRNIFRHYSTKLMWYFKPTGWFIDLYHEQRLLMSCHIFFSCFWFHNL